jgi:hypothetical protein
MAKDAMGVTWEWGMEVLPMLHSEVSVHQKEDHKSPSTLL